MNRGVRASAARSEAVMRVRLLSLLTVLCVVSAAGATEVTAIQSDWSGGPGFEGPVLEWSAGFESADTMAWRAVSGQLALMTSPVASPGRVSLPGEADGAIKVYAADIDLDGDTDVLGSSYYGNELLLFVNDGGSPPSWERQVIDGELAEPLAVSVVDLDGDGLPDILGGSAAGAEVVWWRNLGGSPPAWSRWTIDDDVPGAHDVAGADLDGDGDVDVIAVSFEDDEIMWWRNDGGAGTAWQRFTVASNFDYPTKVAIADVDHDGDLDVFSVAWHDRQIAWWRNEGGDPIEWTGEIIEEGFAGAHWVHACDVDDDGWLDVIGAAMDLGQVAWWRNDGADQTSWQKTVITRTLPGAVSAVAGDLDGDGDLDVAGAGWSASGHMAWFENVDGQGATWDFHSIDRSFSQSSSVHLADVDGNGSLDMLGSTWGLGAIAWWRVGDFVEHGSLTSSILDLGGPVDWVGCGWRATVPGSTLFTVEARASRDPAQMGTWMAMDSGAGCTGLTDGARYLQYRVLFDSTDAAASPILEEISFTWEPKVSPAPRQPRGRVAPYRRRVPHNEGSVVGERLTHRGGASFRRRVHIAGGTPALL